MKRAFVLVLFLFIAASAQHAVSVDMQTHTILFADETTHPAPPYPDGEYTLAAVDDAENVLEQTSFDAVFILPDGTTSPMDDILVYVPTPPATRAVVLLDSSGVELDRYVFVERCGDGICQESYVSCPTDCLVPANEIPAPVPVLDETVDPQQSYGMWVLVIFCVVMIVVLLLFLRHTKKQPPMRTTIQ